MTARKAFVCSLEPTLEQYSLTYAEAEGESAGTASILGGSTAVATTIWGEFHLVPYEMGDPGSVDVCIGDGETRIATVLAEGGGPAVRYVVRDESAAPFLLLEVIRIEARTGLGRLASDDGISPDSLPSFYVRRVNGEVVGSVLRGEKLIRPHPTRKVRCVSHTIMMGDSGADLPDPRLLAALPLTLAMAIGDPHDDRDLGDMLMGGSQL